MIRRTLKVRENRKEIFRYLNNLGSDVAKVYGGRYPDRVMINDVANLDFLNLISPGCIGKIYELVHDTA